MEIVTECDEFGDSNKEHDVILVDGMSSGSEIESSNQEKGGVGDCDPQQQPSPGCAHDKICQDVDKSIKYMVPLLLEPRKLIYN